MSIVVYGGHDRMERIYVEEAKKLGMKAKVHTYGRNKIKKSLGRSDAIVILVDTVSHKIANTVQSEAKKKNIPVLRCQNSSKSGFKSVIENFNTSIQ